MVRFNGELDDIQVLLQHGCLAISDGNRWNGRLCRPHHHRAKRQKRRRRRRQRQRRRHFPDRVDFGLRRFLRSWTWSVKKYLPPVFFRSYAPLE